MKFCHVAMTMGVTSLRQRPSQHLPHGVAQAEPSASSEAGSKTPAPGRTMMSTPMKPAMIASQRCSRTRSCSSGPASPATKNGMVK